jgi:L-rhamnose 1-dehydrogenase
MNIILITGCNGNIALNIIKFLKTKNNIYKIIGCDIQESFDPTNKLQGLNIEYFKTNLESLESIKDFIEKIKSSNLIPDILINNAAIDSVPLENLIEDGMSLNNFTEIFNVNVRAPIYLFKLLSNEWISKSKKGNVVNISTIYSKVSPDPSLYPSGFKKNVLYGSSKAALNSAFKQLSVLYSNSNIRINTLILAGIESPHQDIAFKKKYLERIPIKRFLNINEIYSALIFLIDDSNTYMNGSELVIDGGYCNI